MNTTDEASNALKDAENRIRKVLAASAAKGEYQRVLDLTNVAKQLGVMAAALAKPGSVIPSGAVSETHPAPVAIKRDSDYPKFLRRSEDLIKIGWSKKERKEYLHKMPHAALTSVARAIAQAGAGGKRFAADALEKAVDSHGETIPGYQTYLCLAFLRSQGFVRQEGRSNYSIQTGVDIESSTEAAWQKLTEM